MHRHVSADSGFRSARRRRRYAPEKKRRSGPRARSARRGPTFFGRRDAPPASASVSGAGSGRRRVSFVAARFVIAAAVRGGAFGRRRSPVVESRPLGLVGGWIVGEEGGRRKEEGGSREDVSPRMDNCCLLVPVVLLVVWLAYSVVGESQGIERTQTSLRACTRPLSRRKQQWHSRKSR